MNRTDNRIHTVSERFDRFFQELTGQLEVLEEDARGEWDSTRRLWRRTRREMDRLLRRSSRPADKILDGARQLADELRKSARRFERLR